MLFVLMRNIFLMFYSILFLLLMHSRILCLLFMHGRSFRCGFFSRSGKAHTRRCSHTKEYKSNKCDHFFHNAFSLDAAFVTLYKGSQ